MEIGGFGNVGMAKQERRLREGNSGKDEMEETMRSLEVQRDIRDRRKGGEVTRELGTTGMEEEEEYSLGI